MSTWVKRSLFLLPLLVVVLVVGIAIGALWGDGPEQDRRGIVKVGIADLDSPGIKASKIFLPDPSEPGIGVNARVFLVQLPKQHLKAFLGLGVAGCRVVMPGDPHYQPVTLGDAYPSAWMNWTFQDPCQGSTFALDGDCIGGPCPRGLDRFPVEVHDGVVEIDTKQRIAGARRGEVRP